MESRRWALKAILTSLFAGLLMCLMSCQSSERPSSESASSIPRPEPSAPELASASPAVPASTDQASDRFALADLADPNPAVRRAALPRVPLAEYERLPSELVAELAAQMAEEIGDPLPEQVAAGSPPRAAVAFLVDLAGAIDAAAGASGARVVAGRLEVEGGAAPPRLVTAQMPIHEPGWFATAVAAPSEPLAFHLHGHESVMLRLDAMAPAGDAPRVLREPVVLRPLAEAAQAGIRGRIELDGEPPYPPASLRAWIRPYPINHPDEVYRDRDRWPDPVVVPVAPDGRFESWGFSPTRYYLSADAEGFESSDLDASLVAGGWLDLGSLRLVSSDLSTYLEPGAAEAAPDLDWIDEPAAAFAESSARGLPLLTYTTADWCAPCQLLASTTLEDPWVRGALTEMVLLRLDENEAFNAEYQAHGYPTLIVFDATGQEVHRFAGYRAALPFLRELVQAYDVMALDPPQAIQPLLDGGQLAR